MQTNVLRRIIPTRRPVLMASWKIVIPLHFLTYILYIIIRTFGPQIDDVLHIVDHIVNIIFLFNTGCYLLLYIERLSTTYYLTADAIVRVRHFGAYKNTFRLKYSDIQAKVKYYEYSEGVGAVYINKKTWGAYWDNSRFDITLNTRKKSMVLYYIRNGKDVCDLINQLREQPCISSDARIGMTSQR